MTRLWFRPPAVQLYISSFLGLLDLKTGALIISLFALFNKTAGVFGLLAVFQGGSVAQISLYLYSCASILLFLWALRGIADEDAARTMRYAHAFLADHMLSSAWTLLFGIGWFVYTPHDGGRPQLAPHQAGLMALIEGIEKSYEVPGSIKHHVPLEGEARRKAAQQVWSDERGFSAAVLAGGFMLKVSSTRQTTRGGPKERDRGSEAARKREAGGAARRPCPCGSHARRRPRAVS
ncbi:DUF1753-domain-containing protein [Tilletiopsis washingtonensis]|uniref:DUF1753-domain-containing protein n=1 Tax=Tilletiopsis washingtonensis TaxID=58919 RepID=A0A316ZBC6_9BASI|nr:DUF1753-domain-containing protein [Tilletiopsis washingtonensis]PWN97565.1 DUF1753-domain-containing protein [Tilletiopsis washingtonensis]